MSKHCQLCRSRNCWLLRFDIIPYLALTHVQMYQAIMMQIWMYQAMRRWLIPKWWAEQCKAGKAGPRIPRRRRSSFAIFHNLCLPRFIHGLGKRRREELHQISSVFKRQGDHTTAEPYSHCCNFHRCEKL